MKHYITVKHSKVFCFFCLGADNLLDSKLQL